MNRLEFSCFEEFFEGIFKTRVEYGFLSNPPVEGTVNSIEEKTPSLLSKKLCLRTPSQFPLKIGEYGE
jgi:hypothetical protein